MITHLVRNPMFVLASLALSGSLALGQQTPAPADNSTSAPPAAPIERHAPPPRTGMTQRGARPDMHQRARVVQMERSHGFRGEDDGAMGGGFHLGPSGMWWKSPMVVQRLTLTAEQTKKMDDIFQQSRIQLIDLKANVEKQQVLLEPLISANPVETAKALAQIDKVAQARADLEKADARMLLGIRAVLTPDQWTRLRDHQFGGGPGGQGGPGQPGAANVPGGPGGGGRTRGMHGAGPSPNNTSNLIEPIDVP